MKKLREMVRDWPGRLFLAGLILAFFALIYMMIYRIWDVDLYKLTPFDGMKCGFRKLTGLYCPGCGGTRAILMLGQGRILTSLYYHPIPAYLAALYLNFALRYLFKSRLKPAKLRTVYIILLVVLLLGNWILRNVLLFFGHPL